MIKKTSVFLLVVLSFLNCKTDTEATVTNSASHSTKPNIIYILADDLGYGDLGCYGQTRIYTPYIDKMAQEGMRFTNHYAGSTVCAPSRTSLMTGLDTGHSFIRGNGRVSLRQEDITVAEILKTAGYKTGIIGKWGLGEPNSSGIPNEQGFDYFFGYLNHVRAHNSFPDYLWRNNEKYALPNEVIMAETGYASGLGSVSSNKEVYSNDLFTEEAFRFINESINAPFFLYLAYTIPHANNEYHLLDEHGMEVPSLGKYENENWPKVEKAKAAAISRMDSYVGKILELLKSKGIDKNTLVIFSSDNGPHAEGKVDPEFFDSNQPFRGIKRDLYDGGVRVPMIAWWPGKVMAGKTSDHLSAFWDFLPSCSELAGIQGPETTNGISFVPTLLGRESEQEKHEYLYWEFTEQGGKQALLKDNWKLVYFIKNEQYELYDLRKDKEEKINLINDNPLIFEELKGKMTHARTPSQEFPL
jgi:arylsulfatase A-like enzyme